jgi:hypothetical protein
VEVFIGNPPWTGWEAAAGGDHMPFSRIQDVGVSVCHVGEILDGGPKPQGFFNVLLGFWGKVKSLIFTQPLPTFKHPHLLTTIRFSGIIRNDYFRALINPATTFHLKKLQLNHSSLSLLDPRSLTNLDMEYLQFLEIAADFAYIFHNIDDDKILTNTLALLSNSFPHLVSVNVYIPFESTRELEITKTLLKFLSENSSRLKFLEMVYFHMLSEDYDFNDGEEGDIEDLELEQLANQASQAMQLQALILHINVDRMKCTNYWSRVFLNQTQLEYFVVLSEHQMFTRRLIENISNSLRIIFACVDTRGPDGRPTPLDCSMFNDCGQLSHFSIKGRYDNFMLLYSTPGIYNVEFLPRNIRHIDITRIPVPSIDLAFMMLSMPALLHFVAKFVGRNGQMGVLVETLVEVISRRQLRWFLLAGSINGHVPEEGISNGHPSRPVALLEDDDTFCVKIGRSGYYVMGSPFEDLHNSLALRAGIRNQQEE